MSELTLDLRREILSSLSRLPNIGERVIRDQLLLGLPKGLVVTLPRSISVQIDLAGIFDATERWGTEALIQLLDNAAALANGSLAARELNQLRIRLGLGGERDALPPPYRAPLPPEPWGDRPEFAVVREKLLAPGPFTFVALVGMGGMGKTALAAKIAWDPVIRAQFAGGVFWVTLGSQPNMDGELMRLAAYFDYDLNAHPNLKDRANEVRNLLVGRKCLLIIDDAEDYAAAEVFRNLGASAALLTTRDYAVAYEFAAGNIVSLEQLTQEASISLLEELAPTATEPDVLTRVAAVSGGLPLALRLFAPLLDREARMGWGLDEFLSQLEKTTWRGTVLGTAEKSVEDLPGAEQLAFAQLAVFGAQPATFDLPAAARVWDVPLEEARERMRRFVERNLVNPGPTPGYFSLHQSLADIAATRLSLDDPARMRYTDSIIRPENSHAPAVPQPPTPNP